MDATPALNSAANAPERVKAVRAWLKGPAGVNDGPAQWALFREPLPTDVEDLLVRVAREVLEKGDPALGVRIARCLAPEGFSQALRFLAGQPDRADAFAALLPLAPPLQHYGLFKEATRAHNASALWKARRSTSRAAPGSRAFGGKRAGIGQDARNPAAARFTSSRASPINVDGSGGSGSPVHASVM